MDFSLSEEQEIFRGYVKKYLVDKGQTKVAREYIKGNREEYNKTIRELAELGVTAINVPETYGGMGLGAVDLIPVMEELGGALLPGIYLETIAFAVPMLDKYGSNALKEKYLSKVASGESSISLAWSEQGKSFSSVDMSTSATVEGDRLIIDGVKTLIPIEDNTDAYITLVKTSDAGKDGLSLVLIDQSDISKIKELSSLDETRTLVELTFNQVSVSKEQILGTLNEGWSMLQEGLMHINASLTSLMVGGMDNIVEMATEYAKIREQFGQPIGRFQAIKHGIVNMKLELENARSLSYYANWSLDNDAEDRDAAISSARAFITEAYNRIAGENIQIHGGIGFTEEMDCHLYVKRARYYESYLGTVEEYRERIASALNWQSSSAVSVIS